jgi:hypothetical protein
VFLQDVSEVPQDVSLGHGSLWALPAPVPVLAWGILGAVAEASVYVVSLTPVDSGEVPAAAGEVEEGEELLVLSEVEPLLGRTPSSRHEWGCGPCRAHHLP